MNISEPTDETLYGGGVYRIGKVAHFLHTPLTILVDVEAQKATIVGLTRQVTSLWENQVRQTALQSREKS
jgi:hypothetical protein